MFFEYESRKALGEIIFPQGTMWNKGALGRPRLSLRTLYDIMTQWTVNGLLVSQETILAVIVFGSSVRAPRFIERSRQRYLFFGPTETWQERVEYKVRDIDIFVVTKNDMTKNVAFDTTYVTYYGCGYHTVPLNIGIDMVHRGLPQVQHGIEEKDTVTRAALTDGVEILVDASWAAIRQRDIPLVASTPYVSYWYGKGNNHQLNCVIQEHPPSQQQE